MMMVLDHVAIAAEDLASAEAELTAAHGLTFQGGGQHMDMGTHNRLIGLGPSEYLELITPCPDIPAPSQPRWFDLDRFSGAPRSRSWVCAVTDLDAVLAQIPFPVGKVWNLGRGDLRWRMTIPEDGILPFDGLFPALIEWQSGGHPATRLNEVGVRLEALALETPQAEALRAALVPLFADTRLSIAKADTPKISVTLATETGTVVL